MLNHTIKTIDTSASKYLRGNTPTTTGLSGLPSGIVLNVNPYATAPVHSEGKKVREYRKARDAKRAAMFNDELSGSSEDHPPLSDSSRNGWMTEEEALERISARTREEFRATVAQEQEEKATEAPPVPILPAPSAVGSIPIPGHQEILAGYDDFRRRFGNIQIGEIFDEYFKNTSTECYNFAYSLLSLLYRLTTFTSITDLVFAGFDFVVMNNALDRAATSIKAVWKIAVDAVETLRSTLQLRAAKFGAAAEGKIADALHGLRGQLGTILNSDIVDAVRTFVLSMVSYKFFSKTTALKVQNIFGAARPCSLLDLTENLISATATLIGFGERLHAGERLSEIFVSKDPAAEFLATSDQLLLMRNMTYTGLPVEGRICRRTYYGKLTQLCEDGEQVLRLLPSLAPQRKSVQARLLLVQNAKNEIFAMMTAQERPVPMGIVIVGPPGIGKSSLIEFVSEVWAHVKGREYESTQMYSRDPTSDFWAGYEPLSQPGIHYSEPGATHRSIAKMRGDPTIEELLRVVDNQPMLANMADVESKGKVYIMPEYVVLDCNDDALNLNVILNNPAAIRRRFIFIEPQVKQQYQFNGSCRLDMAKALSSDTPSMDRWTFNLYTQEPRNNVESDKIVHRSGIDIYGLASELRARFTLHIEQQEARLGLTRSVNIAQYFQQPVAESRPPVPPPRTTSLRPKALQWRDMWDLRDQRVRATIKAELLLARVYATEIASSLLTLQWAFTQVFFWACVSLISWCVPDNRIYRYVAERAVASNFDYSQRCFSWRWQQFRATLGLKNNYVVQAPSDSRIFQYLAVFATLVIFVRTTRALKVFSEGSVLSSSREWTQEQVDEYVAKVEQASKCALPAAAARHGTAQAWESTSTPRPELIQHENQLKNQEQIRNAVNKNVRYLYIEGAQLIETRALGVCEDFAIVNRHALAHPNPQGRWEVRSSVDPQGKVGVINTRLVATEFAVIATDLVLVRLRNIRFHDIRQYLPAVRAPTPPIGSVGNIDGTKTVVHDHKSLVALDEVWGDVKLDAPYIYSWHHHARGACGTPLFMEFSSGYGVVGIHSAGAHAQHQSYAESISHDSVTSAIDKLRESTSTLGVLSEGALRLPPKCTGLDSPGERSPLWFEQCPGLTIYGRMSGVEPSRLGKSKLKTSGFVASAEELTGCSPYDTDGHPLFGPPRFSSVIRNGDYFHPYNHFVKKAGVVKKSLDPELIGAVTSVVTAHIVRELKTRGVDNLVPVPLTVAQNGFPTNYYYRAMCPSTSGGWPYPGAKKLWSTPTCLDFKAEAYMPNLEVTEQVVEQIDAYRRELDALPLLGAQLKDEPRSYEKNLTAKTRVFCMSSYESTLVNRMYLMPFYTQMVQHSDIFGASLGINMHSTDVDTFVERLRAFSDEYMEGDYGGFDTSMPSDIGLAANTVVYSVLQELGYNAEALQIVRGILSDNLNPVIVMQGDVFAAPALQPSGKYATAEDNSLRGLIMLVYAWAATMTPLGARSHPSFTRTRSYEIADFFTYVLPNIYGDDLVAAVKPEVREHFNNCTYQLFCAEVYGIDYTNALKTKDMDPFLSIDQISFLKRRFVFREDTGHWVAQLERSSIMKAICYYLPSKSVNLSVQLLDSCVSAMRELFFHEEENTFEALRAKFADRFIEQFPDYDRERVLAQFPTWQAIRISLYDF